jgi:hypothetical protein
MCPMCIGGVVAMASCVMSSGGLSTLAWKKLGVRTDVRPDVKTIIPVVRVEGGKNESANAGE